MAKRSLAILVEIRFPSKTVRLWDGAGPMIADGEVWQGGGAFTGLDEIEMAMNGVSAGFQVSLSSVNSEAARIAYDDYMAGEVIGTAFIISLQPRDEHHQPVGEARVMFTGVIADFSVNERTVSDGNTDMIVADIAVEVVNRLDFRNLPSGSVLTHNDQQIEHPGDRFFERVPELVDKTINWPNYPNN
jgi:hypothetical protein